MNVDRIIISALSGGGGKTITTLGLLRAYLKKNRAVLPFKKGPDYIDTTWLSLAAKNKAYNLDPFFLSQEELVEHFSSICQKEEKNPLAIIEGNRGLYDGKDIYGSSSTAELAAILKTPVVLVIDAKKATRTLVALVQGMTNFDKRINFAGLVFNNTASKRHEKIIRDSIEHYCDVPILGFIPRLIDNPLPERHLGLSLEPNHPQNEEILENLADIVTSNLSLEILEKSFKNLDELVYKESEKIEYTAHREKVRIGYIMDKALWFYYNENLAALKNGDKDAEVELVPLSLFCEEDWLENIHSLDALYIGGGFPEVYAEEISQSKALEVLKKKTEENFPVYAECGGFMLLTHSIAYEDKRYAMANIFSIDLDFHKKPQGLGYVEAEVISENPYFELGTKIKAHEFHYSLARSTSESDKDLKYLFKLDKGQGMGNKKDALLYKNVFAAYTHIYALESKDWAKNFIALAKAYKEGKEA